MAWQHGHYYRKKWVDGTCVSEHVGTGTLGELAEQLDQAERVKRKAKAELHRRMVKADKALRDEVREIGAIVRDMTRLVLLVEGYHQHKRQWRKDSMAETITIPMTPPKDFEMTAAKLNALIERVDAGSPSKKDREVLAESLHAIPALAAALGDTSIQVVEQMLTKMYKQPTVRQATGVHLINMRNDFGYEGANALEKSLIVHVVVCWYRLQYVEQQYTMHTVGQHETKSGSYWDKRLSAAQRRYLRAVESLERVRRMMRPDSPTTAILMQQNVNAG